MSRGFSKVLILLLFAVTIAHGQSMKLWYNKPATDWNEALPIGNGRLAAMVYGDPTKERIQLNEETIWCGSPHNNINPEIRKAIPEIRKLLIDGKYAEAQLMAINRVKSPQNGMPYQPAGDLIIEMDDKQPTTSYYRDLNIADAVSTVKYKKGKITYTRESFASFTDNVIIIRISADKPRSISCKVWLDIPHVKTSKSVNPTTHTLIATSTPRAVGEIPSSVTYTLLAKPVVDGGKIKARDTVLTIYNANSVTFYISIASNFKNYRQVDSNEDSKKEAATILTKAVTSSYNAALKNHKKFYHNYFDRVKFDLGSTEAAKLPTDERIAMFNDHFDPQLVSMYFQYGRYLLISSSQPGGQPANLQGKWNDRVKPPWDCKYTININTEMNYWPSEVAALTELGQPLFQMLKELSVTGQQSASQLYGARGWMAHHNTDLWRITGPVDGGFYGMWPTGGAWLCRHIYQHYLYTGDKEFLKEYYPVLKGAATYFVDALQEEPYHKWLVVSPSMSPENNYSSVKIDSTRTQNVSLSYGTTMDNQIVYDLFSSVIHAAGILDIDKAFADTVSNKRDRLPPMQTGRFGQLQEWINDWDKPNDKHRHISHLFGLYPSYQISPYHTPELFAAAKKTLIERGDQSTGWSMGWKVNFWARMLDGDHAYKLIKDQLRPVAPNQPMKHGGGTYPNLLDAHPPFQIDGNFGCTSGIAEMLLQSYDDAITILPALPSEWSIGEISGLKAKGGFTVDIKWKNNQLTELHISSALGGNCRIRISDILKPTGAVIVAAKGRNTNPFYYLDAVKPPVIKDATQLLSIDIAKTHEYDLNTTAGGSYVLGFN